MTPNPRDHWSAACLPGGRQVPGSGRRGSADLQTQVLGSSGAGHVPVDRVRQQDQINEAAGDNRRLANVRGVTISDQMTE